MSETAINIEQLVKNSAEGLSKELQRVAQQSIVNQYSCIIQEEARDQIREYYKTEIVPIVKQHLDERKNVLVKQLDGAIDAVAAEISTAMKTVAAKNITDSWKFKNITAELFR